MTGGDQAQGEGVPGIAGALAIFEFSQKISKSRGIAKLLEKRRILAVVSLNQVLGDELSSWKRKAH